MKPPKLHPLSPRAGPTTDAEIASRNPVKVRAISMRDAHGQASER